MVGYLFYKEYKPGVFKSLSISYLSLLFLFLAILCMLGRDIGYMIRLKFLSDNKLTWPQTFRIIMLWEFTSAITPSTVGGTSLAVIYITKEGISVGRSTSIVLATSLLDELYFLIMFPLLMIIVNPKNLFMNGHNGTNVISFSNELFMFAIIGYSLKFVYVLLVSYGLFLKPRGIKWLLLKIFKLPIIRRWRVAAGKAGDEIIISSAELKNKNILFWLKSVIATFLSWSSRYLVINFIFLAFFYVSDHLLLFTRQLAMWIMMLVSPTPGGTGFAEYVFSKYLLDYIPNDGKISATIIALAFLWRVITYYPYLIIGSLILPTWIRKKFIIERRQKINEQTS